MNDSIQLTPCTCCHRHIRADERACPFCDAAVPSPASRAESPSSRLPRAALFVAGVAAVAAAAAGSACVKPADMTDAGPRPPEVVDAGVVDTKESVLDTFRKKGPVQPPPMPPYGAPPARGRIV